MFEQHLCEVRLLVRGRNIWVCYEVTQTGSLANCAVCNNSNSMKFIVIDYILLGITRSNKSLMRSKAIHIQTQTRLIDKFAPCACAFQSLKIFALNARCTGSRNLSGMQYGGAKYEILSPSLARKIYKPRKYVRMRKHSCHLHSRI